MTEPKDSGGELIDITDLLAAKGVPFIQKAPAMSPDLHAGLEPSPNHPAVAAQNIDRRLADLEKVYGPLDRETLIHELEGFFEILARHTEEGHTIVDTSTDGKHKIDLTATVRTILERARKPE
jgi:hypothetical protein